MESKKYLGSILAASLLFGIQVRAQDVEKKETKEEEIIKKIENKVEENLVENKTEENAPVVQEEAKNQNGADSEEKSNALAYTLIATGGALAGWVGTAVAKGCQERRFISAFKQEATQAKNIFGMKKEDIEKKQAAMKLAKTAFALKGDKLTGAEKVIIEKSKLLEIICQRALDAQQNNTVADELKRVLDTLSDTYLRINVESLIKKLDDAKTEVLTKQETVKVEASAEKADKTVGSTTSASKDEQKKENKTAEETKK